MNEEILKDLPATRFYGSKRKHLAWIADCLKGYKYQSVIDLFGGTGSISMLFEKLDKSVAFHDSANFNYRQANALFGSSKNYNFPFLANEIRSISPTFGLISRHFRDCYFKDYENMWLDGFLSIKPDSMSRLHLDALFYCVAQAALQKRPFNLFHRKNLYLRLSDSKRTFGNATTWEKSFVDLSINHLNALKKYVQRDPVRAQVKVLKPSQPLKINVSADLLYLDPPYVRADRFTETYAQRYHFLDGMSSPSRWLQTLERNDSNWYQSLSMKEPWGSKTDFLDLISTLLDKKLARICALSYMDGGYPSTSILSSLFKQRFRKVRIYKRDVQRVLSSYSAGEILIVGEV